MPMVGDGGRPLKSGRLAVCGVPKALATGEVETTESFRNLLQGSSPG